MSNCNHHWHVWWSDKLQAVIGCCHCGEVSDQFVSINKPTTCGNNVRSRAWFNPPVHDYVRLKEVCGTCNGGLTVNDGYDDCPTCDTEGWV